jgi:signal transduction histidine kinase
MPGGRRWGAIDRRVGGTDAQDDAAADRRRDGPPSRRGAWTPWLVLAGSLALSTAAALFVLISTRERDRARFDNAVQSASDRIVGRLDVYISTLRGAAALFAADEDLAPDDFRRYIERLEIQRWYPGIQGVGWTRRLDHGLAAEPDERHAIEYLEPLDERNRAAIGYDMYSEPVRREAMRRARDDAEPALSGRVTLVQEIFGPQQAGFLIYVPVYSGGGVPGTVAERRADLIGFVYSPFRANDLFLGIFGSEEFPRVSFSVYDGHDIRPESLLHASERVAGHSPRFNLANTVEMAGREWTVVFESQPEFEATSAGGALPIVMFAGLIASIWLFALALSQARARDAAEAANRAKSGFLATMSHELRTPLNAIGGYVDLIQLDIPGPTTDQQQLYLRRIQRAQQHLLGLINDVLNFAKLDAGRVVFRMEAVSIPQAVREAETLIVPLARDKGLVVESVPGPDVSGLGDAEKVRQILLNLLSNAVKFTESGGTVEMRWSATDDEVRIDVRDTGIGVPRERMESIFDPFLQVDADLTRMRQGTGLGLSIARQLARGMSGEITVQSEPGAGSTFTLRLPLADGRTKGAGAVPPPA